MSQPVSPTPGQVVFGMACPTRLLDPDLQHDAEVLATWAAGTPEVIRVWLFGSRIQGAQRLDSDLDVAVAHDGDYADAGSRQEKWRDALKPRARLTLDLWTYRPGIDTRLDSAIAAASLLVHQRKA